MLLVYRPSSIPDPAEYIAIWAEECTQAGIDAPYVVAVLTRGGRGGSWVHPMLRFTSPYLAHQADAREVAQ